MSSVAWIIAAAAALAAAGIADLRWMRVAQREHYLAPSTTVFAKRWWTASIVNVALIVAGVVFIVLAVVVAEWFWVGAIAVAGAGPIGLGYKGRTSKLAWTRRMRSTAIVTGVVDAVLVVGAVLLHDGWRGGTLGVLLLAQPVVVDIALAILAPIERRSMGRFVDQAAAKLRSVSPTTVAITGSYGKTTTKNYLRHIVAGTKSVLASPASFNNTGGLARTMNEHLTAGTEVLIAEMGTYGPGEIRSLCSWVQPDIAALVNIGPVHLERMKSLDAIVAAKQEIFENASTCVINIDAHGLRVIADELAAAGKRVIRVSNADRDADVAVIAERSGFTVIVAGDPIATVADSSAPVSNVAGAVGLALALSIPVDVIARRVVDLPGSDHRQSIATGASGATVIDNTFSSNPASAAASLKLLAKLHKASGGTGRTMVVTPGMVELGTAQSIENAEFASRASTEVDEFLIVGQTNRAALRQGASAGPANVHCFPTRVEAVEWVRANAGPGDVILYEGDLPDHYP